VFVDIEGVLKLDVPVPPLSGDPSDAAAYQSIVSPAPATALIVTLPAPQRELLPAVGVVRFGFMVNTPFTLVVPFQNPPPPEL
jgi:hypothetical protein